MQEKEQDYAKSTFNDVASRYDEIEFFKISASYVANIIKEYKSEEKKAEYYEAMFTHTDMDGEVELIADTYFVTVKA